MKTYLMFTSLAALIMFAGAAISSDMMAPKAGVVKIDNYAFGPKTITSTPGTEVIWINNDSSSHTVRINGHESPRLRKGGEYRHTFAKAGEYHYQCGIHQSMKGTVVIADASGADGIQAKAKLTGTTIPAPSHSAVPSPVKKHITKNGSTISIVDFMRFSPTELSVPAGTEVTWNNHDGSNHIIQIGNVKSPRLRHDKSFSYRFEKTGEYPFICAIHGKKMSGKIIVE